MASPRRIKSGLEPFEPASPDESSLDVRTRLLRAADLILGNEGIQALTQTRVAEAAGVRQSHLTYYFPTRSALVQAIVASTSDRVLGELTSNPDGRAITLGEFRARLVDRLSDRKMPKRMMAMLVAADEDPTLLAMLEAFDVRICASLEQAFRGLGLQVFPIDVSLFHAALFGISMRNSNRTSDKATQETQVLIGEAFDRLVATASAPRLPAAHFIAQAGADGESS